MNRISTVACVLLLFVSSIAHAAVTYVGTCDSKLATSGVSKTGSGTISAAVIVPQTEYANLDGSKITGLRFGLITTIGISNVKAWVRHSLTGENLAEATVATPVAGWNEVTFSEPITLNAKDSIVLGYDFDQESSVKCISVAGTTQANGYWVAKNGTWQNRSDQVSGSLSAEARVEGDNIPELDLAIESFSYDKVTALGDNYNAKVVVRNMAQKVINGYSYTVDIDGTNSQTVTSNITMKANERDTISISLNSSLVAEGTLIPINVRLAAEGDSYAENDAVVLRMSTYTKTMPHKVLVEEFSTEQCPNCPRAHTTIKNCLDAGLGSGMVLVTHHVGYKTDWLTVDEDKAYEWFYGGSGSTYAPAGMFDRTNRVEYHDANGSSDDYDCPVFSIGYVDTFRPVLELAMSQPSFVSITPSCEYNESTRTMTLNIQCEKLATLDALTSNPRLTVFLIEDSIIAHNQAGISSTTYRHRHTYRKCLTETWGDPVTFNADNQLQAQYSYTLPEDWDDNYVEAVVFLNNYNADDWNDCNVFNAESVEVKAVKSRIVEVSNSDDTRGNQACYNIVGQRISPNAKGIKIINGKKSF